MVPVREDGVDLSMAAGIRWRKTAVPVREDGVDLSPGIRCLQCRPYSPRPRGRGGFKPEQGRWNFRRFCPRPRGRGGFKLAPARVAELCKAVPVREDGVDLSLRCFLQLLSL